LGDVFISYSRDDRKKVADLVERLQKSGVSVWWDPQLSPGSQWTTEVENRIKDSSSVVIVWSRRSIASFFVKAEAMLALNLDKARPVRIDEVPPPFPFETIHAHDLLPPDEWGQMDKLVQVIRGRGPMVLAAQTGVAPPKPRGGRPPLAAMLVTPVLMVAGLAVTMLGPLLPAGYAQYAMMMGGVLSGGGLMYAFMAVLQSRG
jgi:hypothetical protein